MVANTSAATLLPAGLRPLLQEMNDLKRVGTPNQAGSLAQDGFRRAWEALIAGEAPAQVARWELAGAIASARLGAIDAVVLGRVGLDPAQVIAVLKSGIHAVAAGLAPEVLGPIRDAVDTMPAYRAQFPESGKLPSWVAALARQPRAGATRPGHPRLILEPAENHAEHCYLTAVYAALVALLTGADPAAPFVAALAHHFHNAVLPDSGFAGEELLGEHLGPIMDRLNAEALAELAEPLRATVVEARQLLAHADTPEARAFHAGDVLDRVIQMDQFARVAAFELRQALHDLDLVHPGPLQAMQLAVLADVGLWP